MAKAKTANPGAAARDKSAAKIQTSRSAVPVEAPMDCALCPRLATYISVQRRLEPDWFNGPVPSFGTPKAKLLIVGLAPGVRGANRTGRPFTGDYAGDLLYGTLLDFGFATGTFDARPDDGLRLIDCMITNGVRCVPPGNKPTAAEINTCRQFLMARMAALPNLQAVVALGRIAHETTLRGLGLRLKEFPFGHGAQHNLSRGIAAVPPDKPSPMPATLATGSLTLFDSYHCSRYNTNTGRLTTDMFRSVFSSIREHIG